MMDRGMTGGEREVKAKALAEGAAALESIKDAKFRHFFEYAADYILVLKPTPEGLIIVDVNESACVTHGYSRAELVGQPISLLDKDLSDVPEKLEKALAGEALTFEVTHVRKDGSTFPVEASVTVIEVDKKPYVFSIERDITERKRAEEALTESGVKYRAIFENIQDVYYEAALDGTILLISPSIETISSFRREELTGKSLYDIYADPAERDRLMKILREEGKVSDYEITLIDRDGSRRVCSITASLFRDAGGQSLKIVGSMRDITARKISEKMRAQSDVQFRNIVEESPMGIHMYELRDDGRLIFTGGNPAAERILGIDNGQFIGKSIEEAFPPLAETEVPERYRRAAAVGETWHTEQLNYEDKRIVGGFEVHAFQTSPGRMATMFLDITDRKREEEERRRLQEQLLHAQKMESVGTLAGGIAHDFNNILGAILGYTELALDDLSEEALLREYLGEVLKASHRAKNIVKQILAFSRKVEESRRPVDVPLLLDEVVKLLRPSTPTTIDVRREVDSDCGSVLADANQLHQVVMNLCTNAGYAMQKKGGVLTIGCEAVTIDRHSDFAPPGLSEGPYVNITVGDTGAGMSREVRSRIFEPYFTTKPTGEGSGLGLAVALGIVEGHGGKIAVRSEPGKGSTFSLYLPRIDVDVSKDRERAELPAGDERLLFVDDDPSLVKLGKSMLERLGYRVTALTSSVEALRMLSGDPDGFDLVITDQTMPGLTGGALAKEILAQRPGLPVIICTGHSDTLGGEEARRIGVKAYLMKPLNHSDLAGTVRRLLDGR